MQWTFCNPKEIFWNRVVGVAVWDSQIGGRQDRAEVINKVVMKL